MDPNKNVIMWLVLFPPLGMVRVWTLSTWNKKTKILLTVLMILFLLMTVFVTAFPVWYVEHAF